MTLSFEIDYVIEYEYTLWKNKMNMTAVTQPFNCMTKYNPVQNLQTHFLCIFLRFSICCSVNSSDEEDLWSTCISTGRAPNLDPTKHFTFVNCMFSTYTCMILSSKWKIPDLYTSRPNLVRRSWLHKCVTFPLFFCFVLFFCAVQALFKFTRQDIFVPKVTFNLRSDRWSLLGESNRS